MQKFDFRLARLLRLREAAASAAQIALEQARARGLGLEAELQALNKCVADAGRLTKSEDWVRATELANLSNYTNRVDREIKDCHARIAAQNENIRKQQVMVVEARRHVRLLEMLRDRRQAEWQAEADRESNAFAEDFIAAQSARERRDAS